MMEPGACGHATAGDGREEVMNNTIQTIIYQYIQSLVSANVKYGLYHPHYTQATGWITSQVDSVMKIYYQSPVHPSTLPQIVNKFLFINQSKKFLRMK